MKKESLDAAIKAYDIEAECIRNMKKYFDDKQFAKAIELLCSAERIGHRDVVIRGLYADIFLIYFAVLSVRPVLFRLPRLYMARRDF